MDQELFDNGRRTLHLRTKTFRLQNNALRRNQSCLRLKVLRDLVFDTNLELMIKVRFYRIIQHNTTLWYLQLMLFDKMWRLLIFDMVLEIRNCFDRNSESSEPFYIELFS